MDLPEREVPLDPEQRRSHSPPGLITSTPQEDHSSILAMAGENNRRNDVPTSDSGPRPAQHTRAPGDDDSESESDNESIFALRVPPTMQVSTAQYQHDVSDPQNPASHSTPSKALPATVLAVRCAVGAAEAHTPASRRGSQESSFDESERMSDISSRTESSLIDTFLASNTPLTPQLVSVLICMTKKMDDRIKLRLQSVGAHPQGARQCPAGSKSGFGSSASGFTPEMWNHVHYPSGYGTSRQQPAGDGDEDDSEADDDDGKGMNKESVSDLGNCSKGGLACVFFKRFPNSKKLSKACLGPGWNSVHRVKAGLTNDAIQREHIYRVHLQPGSACARCEEVFPTKQQLDRHLRQNIPCDLSTSSGDEVLFITYEQEQQLRKRVRKGKDDERWVGVFQVVFPDVPEHQIPSPYHEIATTLPSCDLPTLHSFKTHALEEIPRRTFRGVDSRIKRALTGPCRRAIEEVFSEFISTLQFTSNNSDGTRTRTLEVTPAVERRPRWSGEVLSPRDNMSLSPGPSFPASSASSVQPTSLTAGVGDSAQSSYVYDHWHTCNDLECYISDPLAHTQPQGGSCSSRFLGGGY
ncbi:hypothetical protein B0H67DRAFT_555696 [Lasiosphaeris hirsuta]|uniref:C2H2-type domain-containing protein n=1 Tax=Lasiosphaeris hirsuta TaxID=260670 RepID=A0AA40DTY9_9PEZI|nr:hypothetical protein B0H67DRAFT_555696 [Lasiosphaeris hirsuta]